MRKAARARKLLILLKTLREINSLYSEQAVTRRWWVTIEPTEVARRLLWNPLQFNEETGSGLFCPVYSNDPGGFWDAAEESWASIKKILYQKSHQPGMPAFHDTDVSIVNKSNMW